jgi:hypothetical protein
MAKPTKDDKNRRRAVKAARKMDKERAKQTRQEHDGKRDFAQGAALGDDSQGNGIILSGATTQLGCGHNGGGRHMTGSELVSDVRVSKRRPSPSLPNCTLARTVCARK